MKGWGQQDDFQEQIAQTEADGVARSRAALEGEGSDRCINEECGVPIDPRRRAAVSNALRCIRCQILFELGQID